eukprot:CAMPEP_0177264920 /NCGR_PEP_ID=MMETSP0367-20130122/61821_1 /TAXON_ID=447022 ORGANISM="Scrippsiella hangoei-like, Strain SHHI-4" /NCGR_SAMPLE_ID=MMETSP0367 /ASSEMBLY_ACC=CAM_ASM_000362 /LENGTH=204 /DNA_ID=CAMNT_0018720081 /DNA_START=122 /DNA_END=733 /DNA_ORIENTATION=-
MAADRGGRHIVEWPSDSLISLTKEVLPSPSEAYVVDVRLGVNDFEAPLFSIVWRKSGFPPGAAGAPVMVMVGASAVAKQVRFRWKCTLPLGKGIAMPISELNVGACPTRNWPLACSFRTAHKATAPMAPVQLSRRAPVAWGSYDLARATLFRQGADRGQRAAAAVPVLVVCCGVRGETRRGQTRRGEAGLEGGSRARARARACA